MQSTRHLAILSLHGPEVGLSCELCGSPIVPSSNCPNCPTIAHKFPSRPTLMLDVQKLLLPLVADGPLIATQFVMSVCRFTLETGQKLLWNYGWPPGDITYRAAQKCVPAHTRSYCFRSAFRVEHQRLQLVNDFSNIPRRSVHMGGKEGAWPDPLATSHHTQQSYDTSFGRTRWWGGPARCRQQPEQSDHASKDSSTWLSKSARGLGVTMV